MDFHHLNSSLMKVEEQSLFHAFHYGEPLDHVPPLLSETMDCLVPLPDSLDDPFNDILLDLSRSDPFSPLPLVPHYYYPPPPLPPPLNELGFNEGISNMDTFSWELGNECISNVIISNAVPISSSGHPILSPAHSEDSRGCVVDNGEEKQMEIRGATGRPKSSEIGLEEIKSYFYMPITTAAKEMNVGLTVLKKRCRELGIARWPHRKMKSLKTLIHNVQELGKGTCEDLIKQEVERLEEHRRLMEENPEIQLTESTKRLRQACFKANYKKRRAMQHPSFDHSSTFFY